MLEVRLIGTFSIQCDSKPVTLSSRAAQSLFAYLILTAGTLHRREKLAGMFWPEASEEKARAYLRHELWRIRKALAAASQLDYLVADDISVSFDASAPYWLDVISISGGNGSASNAELKDTLLLFQGELLPGFYEEWIVVEREHLQAVYEQKMARFLELLEGEKRWTEVLEWAECWISSGQAPEAVYRHLMIAYDALGDRAKVASTYERCAQALRQLDLEPSEQTRALAFKRTAKLKVPVLLTSFIGREQEQKEVVSLLSNSRLVTLTGSGGVGKTRLAIQVIPDMLELFPDGIWFLDLAPLSDPGLVPNTLAETLDLSPMGGSDLSYTDLITGYLRSRRALVIFDNCEHLIEPCAQLVHFLLSSCEQLSILATSREALRVSGEIPYRVPSLKLPTGESEYVVDVLARTESVRLFIERATVVSPGFALGPHNALVIAQVCQRLGGIPLAIELATARVSMLTVDQILKRLDDRFNLLTGGMRTALPRHRTLRATIEWSYDLLSEKESLLFQRLAVFVGGWTLEAAEAVCSGDGIAASEVLDLLSQLVDKSLILVETSSSSGTRYRRLETIRQFACEKLLLSGECHQLRNQHCAYFLDLGEQADRETCWPDKQKWKDRLELDNDNFRTALEWCVSEEKTEAALRLLGGWKPAVTHRYSETCRWFEKIRAFPDARDYPMLYARLLNHIGTASVLRRTLRYAKSVLEESQAIWLKLGEDGEVGLAEALIYLGDIMIFRGEDLKTAQFLFEQSLALYQKHGNEWGVSRALFSLGKKALFGYDYVEAEAQFMKSLSKWKELGDRYNLSAVLNALGELARIQGDYERAGKFYEQSLKIDRELRNFIHYSYSSINFAWILLRRGDYRTAKALYKENLELVTEDGDRDGIIVCLSGFASLLGITGKPEQAARLFSACEALHRDIVAEPMQPPDRKEIDHYIEIARARLDEATFTKAWAEGSEMTLEQAVAFALAETGA